MAERAKNGKKSLIAGICCGVVVIAVVVAVVVIALMNNKGGINDDYFVSDDTKLVMSLDGEMMAFDGDIPVPSKIHSVYTIDGDKISSLKGYYVYENADAAKEALDKVKEMLQGTSEYGEITVDGKYIVLVAAEEEYKDLTVENVKQQIQLMELFKNMGNELTEGGEGSTEVVEETAE